MLHFTGFDETTIALFASNYFALRRQFVVGNDTVFSHVLISSGVSRGCVLGPLLFSIFCLLLNGVSLTSMLILVSYTTILKRKVCFLINEDLNAINITSEKIA